MNSRVCIFCNTSLSGNRAKEHVFPRWLMSYLDIADEVVSPTHSTPEGEVVSVRNHTLKGLISGRICRSCNGGWMSQLEVEAKQILVALMNGEREVIQLSPDERFVLARWTGKTAYCLNYGTNSPKRVPVEHLKAVAASDSSWPEGVAVFGQQHHGSSDFFWLQAASWQAQIPDGLTDEAIKPVVARSYKIVLQLHKLLLLVGFVPGVDWRLVLWRGVHIPLWPQRGPIGWYDSDAEFPWYDSLEAVGAFLASLRMVHVSTLVEPIDGALQYLGPS